MQDFINELRELNRDNPHAAEIIKILESQSEN